MYLLSNAFNPLSGTSVGGLSVTRGQVPTSL
jgi:hypothetical protein